IFPRRRRGIRSHLGAPGRRRGVGRAPRRAHRAPGGNPRVDHDRARARRGRGLGAAAATVPRHRLADPPPRDSVRTLRAAPRAAAAFADRALGQAAPRPRAPPLVPQEGRRMNSKVLSNESQDRPSASGAASGSAATPKPLPADALILIPMRNTVLFPGVITPITVGRASSVAAAQEAVRSEKKVGFLLQRDPQKNEVKPEDLYWVGTAGQVVRYITGAEGTHHLV